MGKSQILVGECFMVEKENKLRRLVALIPTYSSRILQPASRILPILYSLFFILYLISFSAYAQKPSSSKRGGPVIQGQAVTLEGQGLEGTSVQQEGTPAGAVADPAGRFSFKALTARGHVVLRHVGYAPIRLAFAGKGGDTIRLTGLVMASQASELEAVEVATGRDAGTREISMTTLNPRLATVLPSPFGDFNKLLATLPGVVTSSELSSQYSVRGGNYDENLVYVNDMEIYRPTLVRAGQQEGLSFVNPDLVSRADFSSGGWQARYGDKLSSVLNVRYKTPTARHGSVQLGLLTQTAHIELGSPKSRWSFIAGARHKTTQYLLAKSFFTPGLDVNGQYRPSFWDGQAMAGYRVSDLDTNKVVSDVKIILLTTIASNRYQVTPTEQQTQFGNTQGILRLDVAFDGQERLTYNTLQNGLTVSARLGQVHTDVTLTQVQTIERERNNVEGGYRLCEIETDPGKDQFNKCVTTRGVGTYFNYARNRLDGRILGGLARNYWRRGKLIDLEFGLSTQQERFSDGLYEYRFVDSADYVKQDPGSPLITANTTSSWRSAAYLQNTFALGRTTLNIGARVQYWTLNGQWLLSPRAQIAHRLGQSGKWIIKAGGGIYQQPALYRELRGPNGRLYPDLKAQRSIHLIVSSDRELRAWGRPFRLITEVYYKAIPRIIPYDVDNVRIRYLPQIPGRAYAYGADLRFSGEFVKGAESWFSLGLLSTRENITGDTLRENGGTSPRGYLRRPTDQRATLGFFFQDHLPKNPTFRVYVNTVIGTGLPFGPPGSIDNRARLRGPSYRRVDIGFSKVVALGDRTQRLGRYFETLSIALDVLNLIGANNTISYTWIKDVTDTQFAVPNYLSQRFFNLKIRVEI